MEISNTTASTTTTVSGAPFPSTQDFSRFSILPDNAAQLSDVSNSWTLSEIREIQESLIDFDTGRHKSFDSLEEFLEDLHSD